LSERIEGKRKEGTGKRNLFPVPSLSHAFTAAINLICLDKFLEGKRAAKTQVSPFAAFTLVELASERDC
jgi:hypothetical protein